ncbi:MAG: signal peptidase I [Promethearchaeota archaeon]
MQRKNIRKKTSKDKRKPIQKKKIFFSVFTICFAFFGSFLIYFILQIALNTKTPLAVVQTGSMEPTLYKGDLIILTGKDPEDIKEGSRSDKDGDIIVYDPSGLGDIEEDDPYVHRVIDKWKENGKWYFLTKGDANSKDDEELFNIIVPEDHILGVVCARIPYVGWFKIFLTDTGLFIPLIIILTIPLIISIIWDFIKPEEEEEEEEKIKKVKDKEYITAKDEDKYLDDIEVEETKDDDFDF